MLVIVFAVLFFAVYGPLICAALSVTRLRQQDYGSAEGDASNTNLKPALDLFYYLCCAQGLIFVLFVLVEFRSTDLLDSISRQYGFSWEVLFNYCTTTKLKYVKNLASTESWNFITYGAGLLDSEMPEDNAFGATVLTLLIEQGIQIRRVLTRSPRPRIQKLIGALVWRSPADTEMRWLAARIVEHLASDLNLAQFPGALECISTLLDTSGQNNGEQGAIHVVSGRRKKGNKSIMDLILHGLRILDNLADDEHNCTVIYNTKGLLSKIIAPVSSNNLVEDIKINAAWTKVVYGSLGVVIQLMGAPGDTGKNMCQEIANNSNAIENLEAVLGLESNSSSIIELQILAIQVVAQLCLVVSTSLRKEIREELTKRALHIFLTDKWMEDYLADRKTKVDEESKIDEESKSWGRNRISTISRILRISTTISRMVLDQLVKRKNVGESLVEKKMNEAQETALRLREKAGEAVVILSMGCQNNSEAIRSFTGLRGSGDVVHCLTQMLDSEMRIIRCRISAAVILKHLCIHCALDLGYVKEILKKILSELLHISTESQAQASGTSTPQWWNCVAARRTDIENPGDGGQGQHEPSALRSLEQLCEERRLQAALLSLCAAIRKRWIDARDFASVVVQLVAPEDFVVKLKEMVDKNSDATPACLAILKLSCEMVIALIPHDETVEEIKKKREIVDILSKASETMAGPESCLLFAGTDRDCHGVPVKPLYSVLVKQVRDLVTEKEQQLVIIAPEGGP